MQNFDMALLKNLALTDSKSVQFGLEAFNAFNRAVLRAAVGGWKYYQRHVRPGGERGGSRLVQAAVKFAF